MIAWLFLQVCALAFWLLNPGGSKYVSADVKYLTVHTLSWDVAVSSLIGSSISMHSAPHHLTVWNFLNSLWKWNYLQGLSYGDGRLFSCGADGSIHSWTIGKKGELEQGVSREKAHKDRVSACLYKKVWDCSTCNSLFFPGTPQATSPQWIPFMLRQIPLNAAISYLT